MNMKNFASSIIADLRPDSTAPYRFNQSLGFRLLRVIFGLYFMVTATVTAVQMISEYHHTRSLIFTELKSFEPTYRDSFAQSLWAFNTNQLEAILQGLSQVTSVTGISVSDAKGDVVTKMGQIPDHNDKNAVRSPTAEKDIYRVADPQGRFFKEIYEYAFDVKYLVNEETQTIGSVHIYSSDSVVISRVEHGFILIVINSLIKTVSLFFIFLICATIMVVRPLRQFSTALLRMDAKHPKEDPAITEISYRKDELGHLGRSFHLLMDTVTQNIEVIGELNTNLESKVRERTAELRTVLSTLKQGIFTFNESLRIDDEYSSYVEEIFETKDIADRPYDEVLFLNTKLNANDINQCKEGVAAIVGFADYAFIGNAHLLVREMERTDKNGHTQILELDWEHILDDRNNIKKLLVSVKDVTEARAAALEAAAHRAELELLDQILKVGTSKMTKFIKGAKEFMAENRKIIESGSKDDESLNLLFRNMHTLKGNSRTYGLSHVTEIVHSCEQLYQDIKQKKTGWDQGIMLRDLDTIATKIKSYEEIISKKLSATSSESSEDIKRDLGLFLSDEITSLGGLAKSLAKETPKIVFANEAETYVFTDEKYSFMKDVMMHLLRNAMDHGIEKPDIRIKKGKAAAGTISVHTSLEKKGLCIRLADDGAGMNLGALAKKADASGYAYKTDEELGKLIFASGMSTATQLTDISGRGVGMDAVRSFLEKQGGSISFEFSAAKSAEGYRPFTFIIKLPLLA